MRKQHMIFVSRKNSHCLCIFNFFFKLTFRFFAWHLLFRKKSDFRETDFELIIHVYGQFCRLCSKLNTKSVIREHDLCLSSHSWLINLVPVNIYFVDLLTRDILKTSFLKVDSFERLKNGIDLLSRWYVKSQ